MPKNEIDQIVGLWEFESGLTRELLNSIPADRYDFRPDPHGRSMGELAWHLAALESIMSRVARGRGLEGAMTPELEQPRTVPEIVSGYERIHQEAVERVKGIRPEDLDVEFPFFSGPITVRHVLRFPLLHHLIHHRGQLMMMIRMAGAVPSKVYGPNREDRVGVSR